MIGLVFLAFFAVETPISAASWESRVKRPRTVSRETPSCSVSLTNPLDLLAGAPIPVAKLLMGIPHRQGAYGHPLVRSTVEIPRQNLNAQAGAWYDGVRVIGLASSMCQSPPRIAAFISSSHATAPGVLEISETNSCPRPIIVSVASPNHRSERRPPSSHLRLPRSSKRECAWRRTGCKHQPSGFPKRHPHTIGEWNPNNTIYIGRGCVAATAPSCLRLSIPGERVTRWRGHDRSNP